MNTFMKVAAVAATAFAVAIAGPVAVQADDHLGLKPVSGRFSADFEKRLGAGNTARAHWTKKEARTGKFSVLLEKSVPTSEPSFAAVLVTGVEGTKVSDLGSIGFWVKGTCGGGSPRFNLHYDTDGDGDRDGTAFYGCANHMVATVGGWTEMRVLDPTVSDNGPVPLTAEVLSLSVLVDETGTYYIDDVLVDGQTLGEPSD